MAKSNACWGIDIGQCALKAIRCRLDDRGEALVAEAFDYIEYPKILSQPDADPQALVREALEQFLSRNSVAGDTVALSVPGQNGLTRFIKLPPVETKKIPDIVKYEAKQQIPFDLEDVIWDYQPMGDGPSAEMATDLEVGLFAMKRDQVFRAIRPLQELGIELDVVQLTPLCVFNAVVHGILPADHDPSKSVVVLSMGTETTDLVVTNGRRVWQRSIPIGGSHFTKHLTKELKLTFAKAEHLKRNAHEAEDPKSVFQAMRSVFSDMVTEVQRSIGYFRSIHRDTEIERLLVLGNAFKLPGLAQYLSKNLGFPVRTVDEFRGLSGASVVGSPSFKENILSFGVAYGLAIQGLGQARIRTNLVPRELIRDRLIRQRKPAVLVAASVVLVALCMNYYVHWSRWASARPEKYQTVFSQVQSVVSQSQSLNGRDTEQQQLYDNLKKLGEEVVRVSDSRLMVLELMTAINQALPVEESAAPGQISDKPFGQRKQIHIDSIDSKYFVDLSEWYTSDIQQRYNDFLAGNPLGSGDAAGADAGLDMGLTQPIAAVDPALDAANGGAGEVAGEGLGEAPAEPFPNPAGPGWVIQLSGYHLFNEGELRGAEFVAKTLMESLENGKVQLPQGPGEPPVEFTMKELGISHPVLVKFEEPRPFKIPNPDYQGPLDPMAGPGTTGPMPAVDASGRPIKEDPNNPRYKDALKCEFVVQFAWRETPLSRRLEARSKGLASAVLLTDGTADEGL